MVQPVKLILCADSGAGKTGSCASLAAAGYSLRVMDLDNGADILRNLLLDSESPYVKANPKVGEKLTSIVPVSEPRKVQGGKLAAQKAEAWSKATGLLENWVDGDTNLGSIASWTTGEVLVIDSFTRLGEAAMRFIQAINGRLNQKPYQSDFGDAQALLRNFLEIIFSPDVSCNVVLNCHVAQIEGTDGIARDYPLSVGQKLSPLLGSYVNSLLTLQRGKDGKVLRTTQIGTLGVKNTAPFRVKPEYPISTGLADYFAAVRGT